MLTAKTRPRPSRSTRSAMVRSCFSNGVSASSRSTTTSAKRMARSASPTASVSGLAVMRALRRRPAVSKSRTVLALPVEFGGDGVAGQAGFGAGDHALLAQKRVGERGFSGVGPPGDGELERPVPAFPALLASSFVARPVALPFAQIIQAAATSDMRSEKPRLCSAENASGSPSPSSNAAVITLRLRRALRFYSRPE